MLSKQQAWSSSAASTRPEPAQIAKKTICSDPSATLSLVVYPPNLRQPAHAHPEPSFAVLLCGSIAEETASGETVIDRPSIGCKPPDLRHSTRFGDGATILLSLTVRDDALWRQLRVDEWQWGSADVQAGELLAAADRGLSSWADTMIDLLAAPKRSPAVPGSPPGWLCRVREELRDAPDTPLETLAARAGVHRVHLSRSFSRWFGEAPTVFRLRRRTELALAGVLHHGRSPAAAAAEAGFADQSHLARSVRRIAGTTVRGLSGGLH